MCRNYSFECVSSPLVSVGGAVAEAGEFNLGAIDLPAAIATATADPSQRAVQWSKHGEGQT
jgi:hypothetical protein